MATTAVQTAQENIRGAATANANPPTKEGVQQPIQQEATTTVPTSRIDQQKEAQQQKLEMIEVVEALRSGQLPTNDKLCEFLERLLNVSAIENRRQQMSLDGQQLLMDLQDLIRTMQKAIRTKNTDQLFQSLYYHVHQIRPTVGRGMEIMFLFHHQKEISNDCFPCLEHFKGIDYTAVTDREAAKSEAQQGMETGWGKKGNVSCCDN